VDAMLGRRHFSRQRSVVERVMDRMIWNASEASRFSQEHGAVFSRHEINIVDRLDTVTWRRSGTRAAHVDASSCWSTPASHCRKRAMFAKGAGCELRRWSFEQMIARTHGPRKSSTNLRPLIDLDATEDQLDFPSSTRTREASRTALRIVQGPAAIVRTMSSVFLFCGDLRRLSSAVMTSTTANSWRSPSRASSTARCSAERKSHQQARWQMQSTKITTVHLRGLDRDEAEQVQAGDIVALAGVEGIQSRSITIFRSCAARAADH